jgi:transcriptional regulator with XRE-family HTH domain
MIIDETLCDAAVLGELGERIMRLRLDLNKTQEEFAKEAGIGKRTLERIENGETSETLSLIRALRTLNVLQNLQALLPEAHVRPMDMLKLGKKRQRAARKRSSEDKPDWKWGDEV